MPQHFGITVQRFQDGGELLGFSLLRPRLIAVDERLENKPEFVDVLLHESAHVLSSIIDPPQNPIEFCEFRQSPSPDEIMAWQIAGRAAVSRAQYEALRTAQATVPEIACLNGVSQQLVSVGLAVHLTLDRRDASDTSISPASFAVGMLCSRLYQMAAQL